MNPKKGLVRNQFDGHSIVDALTDAFEIKKEVEKKPYQFVESSRSLIIKPENGMSMRIEEASESNATGDDMEEQLRRLISNR